MRNHFTNNIYYFVVVVLVITFFYATKAVGGCIGNNYEQRMPLADVILPVVNFATATPTAIKPSEPLSLTAKATVHTAKGGRAFFYWCTDVGTLAKDPNYPDYSTVKYTAPSSKQTVKIGVQVGDTLGYIDTQFTYLTVTNSNVPVVEKPNAPKLLSLGKETPQSQVELQWQKVVDSHYQDNVDYYEVQYATKSQFKNAKTLNAGDPSSGKNIYEAVSYTVTGLKDGTKYYFRVRAVNSVGNSNWSNYETILVNLQNLPYFDTAFQQPANNATGVSKTPMLKWRAKDADGDPLNYRVTMGVCPDASAMILRSFKPKDSFDFKAEGKEPLAPNTTYCWQVSVVEKGHEDKAYYGGEYIKSPVWKFTTSGQGPDLALTAVTLIGTIQPDSYATFKVTVKNVGTETSTQKFIKSFYVKNGSESEFLSATSTTIPSLVVGNSTTLNVKVKFSRSVTQSKGIVYDNVLIPGSSQIRFAINLPNTEDVNKTNDSILYTINYGKSNPPSIGYFQVEEHGRMYDGIIEEPFWARMGQTLLVSTNAEDDMAISSVELQYRLHPSDPWVTVSTQQNMGLVMTGNFDWIIPTTLQPTDEAQVQIVVRDGEGQTTIKTSNVFSIYSNYLQGTIEPLVPSYSIGSNLQYQITVDAIYPIKSSIVDLICDSQPVANISVESNSEGLVFASTYHWLIADIGDYISTNCHLKMLITDIRQNVVEVSSATFAISASSSSGGGSPGGTTSAFLERISAGDVHTCAIKPDNTVACWGANGYNDYGQAVSPSGTFSQISAGWRHSCGVKTDGTVACWGDNTYGKATPPAGTFSQVGAGFDQSCGLKTDGTVVCWGYTYAWQTPPTDKFSQISVGTWHHVCGIKIDGTVACWGDNTYGQSSPPTGTFSQISAGWLHTCGLRTDNTLACWGSNYSFDGSIYFGQATPPSGAFSQVSAGWGSERTCAVKTDGTAICWGRLDYGEFPPLTDNTISQISTGTSHTCALKVDGSIMCWGSDSWGQSSPPSGNTTTPVVTPSVVKIVDIEACLDRTFAIDELGRTWAWGLNNYLSGNVYGQLGVGNTPDQQLTPILVPDLTEVSTIACHSGVGYFTVAQKKDGTLWGWGSNGSGQLGTGSTVSSSLPVKAMIDQVKAVAAGQSHIVVAKQDGTVWVSGKYAHVNGTDYKESLPKQILELSNAITVAAGDRFSVALTATGEVWTWGKNNACQLGDDTFVDKLIPVKIANLTGVKHLSVSWNRTFALKSDGTVWAWGYYDSTGSLGNPNAVTEVNGTSAVCRPVQLSSLTSAMVIDAGRSHSVALQNNSLWAWGDGQYYGFPGNYITEPTSVAFFNDIADASAGGGHTVLLRQDESVWTVGINLWGQLGDGTLVDKSTPVKVMFKE